VAHGSAVVKLRRRRSADGV